MLSTGSSGNGNMLCYLLGFFCLISEIYLKNSIYTKKTSVMQTMVCALFESFSESSHLMSSPSHFTLNSDEQVIYQYHPAQGGPPTPKLNKPSLSHCNFFFYSPPSRSNQWGCDTRKSRFTVLVFSLESEISKIKTKRSKCYLV